MSANAPDFYTQKTDAKLLIFVECPALYSADLVEAARRELHCRGVLATPVFDMAHGNENPAPGARRLLHQ